MIEDCIAEIQTPTGTVYALCWQAGKNLRCASKRYSSKTLRRLGWKRGGEKPKIVRFHHIKAAVPGPLIMLTLAPEHEAVL